MEILTQTPISSKRRNLETQGMQLSWRMHPHRQTRTWAVSYTWQQMYCLTLMKLLFVFSIYEKLIQFCAIDELGTNYPKDMFDPHAWSEDSYYEALGKSFYFRLLVLCDFISALIIAFNPPAKAQKVEMDKLEKAKKERTKVSLTTKKSGLLCQSASGASLHQLYFISTLPPSDTQKSMLPSWALVTAARAQPRADVLVGFTHSGLLHKKQLLPPPPQYVFLCYGFFWLYAGHHFRQLNAGGDGSFQGQCCLKT